MNESKQGAAPARSAGGFARAAAMLLAGVAALMHAPAQAQSVCAEVKIEIKQTVTLERQAFDAVLKIRNGLALPVEALDVELRFADADGVAIPATTNPNDTAAKFFFRTDGATGITGELDGSGVVAPTSNGEAHWLIVPTASAGGQTPDGVAYRVGAKITYRMGSETKTVEVTPDTITVKPQPKLKLDYFLPGPVYGDDPMTPAVEPLVPFTLGVRVWNYGYGRANAVAIESAQPKIVENRQGLLVDFRILDSYVGDAPAQPTLTPAFGALAGGTAKMGRWNMTASLSGTFSAFDATIRHADEFGGALTSLIAPEDIKAHELVRDVLADAPGRDGVRDFLARDGDVVRLYESDGGLAPGTAGATDVVEASGTLGGGGNTRELTVAAVPGGFVYAKVADPFEGQLGALSVRRQDGKTILAANAWFSKERDASGERWLHFINVFDFHDAAVGASVRYTLTTGETPPTRTASLEGVVFDDADADGVRDDGEAAMFDVPVTLGGAESRSARTDALGRFVFRELAAGTYTLASGGVAGYRDGVATAGSAGGTVQGAAIEGIALGEGVVARGYTYAKVAGLPPQKTADLSVVLGLRGTGRPEGIAGMNIRVSAIVNNLGPSATLVRARFVLPPGAIILNGPADFMQTGVWQVDAVIPHGAKAYPSFDIRIPAPGPATVSVSVEPAQDDVVDVQRYNNSASKTTNVLPGPQYIATLASESEPRRLLVLAACPPTEAGTEDAACLDQRVAAFKAMFPENFGVRLQVVRNERDFLTEMRSRHWLTYWIDSGAARVLSARAIAELAHAALRGDPVLIDRPRGRIGTDTAGAELMEEYIPLIRNEAVENAPVAAKVRFSSTDNPFPSGVLAVVGGYDRYTPAPGAKIFGTFETAAGTPSDPGSAPVVRFHGLTVFGFDLMAALQANAQYRAAFLQTLALKGGLTSRDDAELAAGRRVDVVATVVGYGVGGLPTWVGMRFPNSLVVEEKSSGATPFDGGTAWTSTLQSNIGFTPRVRFRLPTSGNAEHLVRVEVRKNGPTGELMAEHELRLDMLGADRLATDVATELDALGKPDAVDAITAAMASRIAGRLDDAIGKVIDVSEVAAPWRRGEDTSARMVRIVSLLGDLVEVLYREWYVALPPCTPGKAEARGARHAPLGISVAGVVSDTGIEASALPPPADLSGACRSPVR